MKNYQDIFKGSEHLEKVTGGWVYQMPSGWWRCTANVTGSDFGPYPNREDACESLLPSCKKSLFSFSPVVAPTPGTSPTAGTISQGGN